METLVVIWGYILAIVLFIIALVLYFWVNRLARVAEAQRGVIRQNRDYFDDIKCVLYDVKRSDLRQVHVNDHDVASDIKKLSEKKNTAETNYADTLEELSTSEKKLGLVREWSQKKNLVISKQKKRILEFECAYESLKSSNLLKDYEYFSKLLTMARKETIQQLEKRLKKKTKKVCKRAKKK